MIYTVMAQKCGFNQDEWKVKYWTSNILVIRLYSEVTVGKILSFEVRKYQTTQVALYLFLFFMRFHLVAVNFKGNIQAKEHVMMLWSSFLFFIHIYGFHITSKIYWISECVSFCLLIMRSNIVEPRLLTFEPSRHTDSMIRGIQREFTVRDFLTIVNKLHRIWKVMVKGDMKARKQMSGYVETLAS